MTSPRRARLIIVSLCLAGALAISTGCKDQECAPEPELSDLRERFDNPLEESLDAIDPTKAQERAARALVDEMFREAMVIRAKREPSRRRFIDSLMKSTLPQDQLLSTLKRMFAPNMALYHTTIDRMRPIHATLSATQRASLVDAWDEPFEPVERTFLINRGIDWVLSDLDLTDAQDERFDKAITRTFSHVNRAAKASHTEASLILAQVRLEEPNMSAIHKGVDRMSARWFKAIRAILVEAGPLIESLSAAQHAELKSKIGTMQRCPAP